MSDNKSNGGFRVGFFGLLGLLFIGLKLGGVIGWSWVWVLAPLWIGPAIFVVILILAAWASMRIRKIRIISLLPNTGRHT